MALEEARHHGAELSAVTVIPEIVHLPILHDNLGNQALDHVNKQAQAIGADLIVMASPKGDIHNYMMGPKNVARAVRNPYCSALVVRG